MAKNQARFLLRTQ
uniref:Uncharacterized protein n=1 Tax=Anguilla anguilla TaxID=7936 RepID=A0A0E9VHP7_ANGAN